MEKVKRAPKPKEIWQLPRGTVQGALPFDKFHRDVLRYVYGEERVFDYDAGGKKPLKEVRITTYDPEAPMAAQPLVPSVASPICAKCCLYEQGCKTPFMAYAGPENPTVTVVYDVITPAEDIEGSLNAKDRETLVYKTIESTKQLTGIEMDEVRWVPMTRCCAVTGKKANVRIKGGWCRYHVVDDLLRHPPKLIIPVGTAVLGLLCHKSNVQDWQGRVLTYRGWPDDWITNPDYMLERPDPQDATKTVIGHPLFGAPPEMRIPMVPVQIPRLVLMQQNPGVTKAWKKAIVKGVRLAKTGFKPNSFLRKWYHFTEDPAKVEAGLNELLSIPGIRLCYDTETTGLRAWASNAAIVSIMFRWDDPETNEPKSLGFPWDYAGSPLQAHVPRLKQLVWAVLIQSQVIGHNLTFDVLYTFVAFWRHKLKGWDDPELNRRRDSWLCALANSAIMDTWHATFALEQKPGTLGLESLMYRFVPKLAGYEEEMTLLIELLREKMHPDAGGHYLNCPADKRQTHLVPYVMGDVEGCYEASKVVTEKLDDTETYTMPLACPGRPGMFRHYTPPNRAFVYHNIMLPASRTLNKLMMRGMYIDEAVLARIAITLPQEIRDARIKMRGGDPRIEDWCRMKEATEEKWELDLENKTQLKELLFDTLQLPVQRFTKGGKALYGDDAFAWDDKIRNAILAKMPDIGEDALEDAVKAERKVQAAVDKFTLNKLAVDHAQVRPLQEYRKVFKLYSTYVRPVKNIFTKGIDKKERKDAQHLCFDSCIHAGFLLTGTRGGRLSSRAPNLQQLPRDGVVKEMYRSRFGKRGCIYQGDLSQIELRLMAAVCGDETLVKAYFDNVDLHSLTTSRIFNVPYEHFSKDYMKFLQKEGHDKEAKALDLKRSIGKICNFLTGYGGGAFGLQNILANKGIYKSIEECQSFIDAFFDAYPALKKFLQHYKWFIQEKGVAVSVTGRVRYFDEMHSEDDEAKAKAMRAGCNHLIQATASDMMLTALTVIENEMREENLESILVSTVHDSLVVDAVREELPIIHDITTTVLNNYPEVMKMVFGPEYDTSWLLVPISGDAEVGPDYLHQSKLDLEPDWDEVNNKLDELAA